VNKSIFLSGIVVSAIVAIAPAVTAQSIGSGLYSNEYPDNLGIKIRNNSYSVQYDDAPPDPWKSIPKGVFNPIKSGVFYSNNTKLYYCLVNNSLERERGRGKKSKVVGFSCSKNGWRKIYR
jgi:hypothetical protein